MKLLLKFSNAALKGFHERSGFVFVGARNYQVFWSVVVSYAVDVVNNFFSRQSSANDSLHDESVFGSALAMSDVDFDIALRACHSTALPQPVIWAAAPSCLTARAEGDSCAFQSILHRLSRTSELVCEMVRGESSLVERLQFIGRYGEALRAIWVWWAKLYSVALQPWKHVGLVHPEVFGNGIGRSTGLVHGDNLVNRRYGFHVIGYAILAR